MTFKSNVVRMFPDLTFIISNLDHDLGLKFDVGIDLNFDLDSDNWRQSNLKILSITLVTVGLASLDLDALMTRRSTC
jgi:hypothetical protein